MHTSLDSVAAMVMCTHRGEYVKALRESVSMFVTYAASGWDQPHKRGQQYRRSF